MSTTVPIQRVSEAATESVSGRGKVLRSGDALHAGAPDVRARRLRWGTLSM